MQQQNKLIKELEIGGRIMQLETGRVAKQAGGAVLVRYGDTVVLVNATMAKKAREGLDFFPLTCDYEERLYAVGKIPGGFIKREGRPSEKAILTSRLIDRPIRPLFPKGMRNEVQVIAVVMSVDQDNPPEMAAMVGASAALHISNIPFNGPIGGVIVGRVDNKFIINPDVTNAEKSDMHLVVAGTHDAVMMVEAGAREVPEETMLDAIMFGHEQIRKIVEFIEDFRREALELGLAKEKYIPALAGIEEDLEAAITPKALEEVKNAVQECIAKQLSKKDREALLDQVKENLLLEFAETYPEQEQSIVNILEVVEKKVVRRYILFDRVRIDGRALNEVRPISVEVGVLPRTHGSGLFTRGQTQVLSIATLGAISEEQILDGLGVEETKRFMHHYNFPPFSTGETKPMRSPGRREIGHGALAERALEPVIPPEEKFPYTIRLVSEVLESNGSTSMGSVCGSCLALMDSGVPIKAPVAGVAMGLIKEDNEFAILTDIQGLEDHLGDMDFKVAGTTKGVTALQMDIKIAGIDRDILQQALRQATEGRMHILGEMTKVLAQPREDLSPYAPRIIHTVIDPDKIRDVIGPGGKIIKKIIEETGVDIDIEDDGRVFIAAVNPDAGKNALSIIQTLTKEVQSGEIYRGKVVRVTDFGCFVEVVPGVLGLPGKDGLVHISQLAHERVDKVEDVVREGDIIEVKVIGYDNQGRLKLSRKDVIPVPEGFEKEKPRDRDRDRDTGRRPRNPNNRRPNSNRSS
ncbi:polyribonucleotide nucleotidyltransferase [Desulfotomaculum arcticum]|uniref:Polyribonucleotide nucleotidyltransferase n=1 Tax=Desulfotruncus arcticus DSM 17038 TaxID=1121424 RepID=A0A1I2S973_9FIRM|nr:polyribonucleotide nucleotidyltransferase [Desulfotruncus arcticus]SFG49348.1 polyribonucleotide nucleotidyltransferase [Desulfotomaculum arcticum] [Desulfotruncus arcticus DSM 17038]